MAVQVEHNAYYDRYDVRAVCAQCGHTKNLCPKGHSLVVGTTRDPVSNQDVTYGICAKCNHFEELCPKGHRMRIDIEQRDFANPYRGGVYGVCEQCKYAVKVMDISAYETKRKREKSAKRREAIPTVIITILGMGIIFGIGWMLHPYMPSRIITFPRSMDLPDININILAFPLAGFLIGIFGISFKWLLKETILRNPLVATCTIGCTGITVSFIMATAALGNPLTGLLVTFFTGGIVGILILSVGIAGPAVAGFLTMEFLIEKILPKRNERKEVQRVVPATSEDGIKVKKKKPKPFYKL
jgi:hypothetical protein